MNRREHFVSSHRANSATAATLSASHGAFMQVNGISGGRGIRTHGDGDTVSAVFKSQRFVSARVSSGYGVAFPQFNGSPLGYLGLPFRMSEHGNREQSVSSPPLT